MPLRNEIREKSTSLTQEGACGIAAPPAKSVWPRRPGRGWLAISLLASVCALPAQAQVSYLEMRSSLANDSTIFDDWITQSDSAALQALCASLADAKGSNPCGSTDAGNVKLRMRERFVERVAKNDVVAERERRAFVERAANSDALGVLARSYDDVQKIRQNVCARVRPQIHNIGNHAVLTFESKEMARAANAGQRALRIPIDGYGLNPKCTVIGVQIEGTVPISRYGSGERDHDRRDYHVDRPSEENPDVANIVLLEPYLDRLSTGDKISVSVEVSSRYQNINGGNGEEPRGERKVAYGKRSFTLYEVKDYRDKFLKSRIGPHDFNAFPLPDDEARYLFGPLVQKNYFVVRLSMRNIDNEAKLVSTGMIRASGIARVEPKSGNEPAFSAPVTIVPHSIQQIYTVLQDEEVDQLRPRVFRALEFIGALAAGVNAITSASIQATKNVGLFTGIFIPEGRKAWPDRWPGYQRNIVNYAMPDLVKVPANSVVDHKFLFFSKKEIDGLVSDPYLFGNRNDKNNDRQGTKPDAYVIALGFDNLDIRFEKVFDVAVVGARDDVLTLTSDVALLLERYKTAGKWLAAPAPSQMFGSLFNARAAVDALSPATLNQIAVDWKNLRAKDDDPDPADLQKDVIDPLTKLVGQIKYSDSSTSFSKDMFAANVAGQPALESTQTQVHAINQKLLQGVDASTFKAQVDSLNATYKSSRQVYTYYMDVFGLLPEMDTQVDALKNAIKTLKDAKATDDDKKAAKQRFQQAGKVIADKLDSIGKQKPAIGVSLVLK